MSSYKELKLLGQMIDSGQTGQTNNKESASSQPIARVVGFSAPTSSSDVPAPVPTPSIAIPVRASSSPFGAGSPLYSSWSPLSSSIEGEKRLSSSIPTGGTTGSLESSSPASQGIKIVREPVRKPSSLSSSLSSNGGISELSSSIESKGFLSTMIISSAGVSAAANTKPSPTNASPIMSTAQQLKQQGKQQQRGEQREGKEQQQGGEKKEQQPKREKQQQQHQPREKQQQQQQQQQGGQQGGGEKKEREQQPKREKQQQPREKQQQGQPSQKQQQNPQQKQEEGKEKGQQGGAQKERKGQQHAPTTFQYDDTKKRHQAEKKKIVQHTPVASSHQVPLFSHLPQYERASSLSTKLGFAGSDVHPSILQLGIMYSNFKIAGSNARAVAMLTAFKQVIKDFETPPAKTFHRELDIKLKPQIQFLIDCRPMSISMGNAINFLKQQMTQTVNLEEEQAKQYLLERIDSFIQERIVLADQAIATYGVSKINHNDVILTFARSHVVELIIKKAFDEGKKFRVVVVDSRPKLEGKALLTSLTKHGVPCTYIMLNGISYIMKEVSKVFLGAYSLLSNGALISRVGTAVVATMAHSYNVPVMVCCETYKFTERVHLDSICFNQLGDPDELPETADYTSTTVVLPVPQKDKDAPSPSSPSPSSSLSSLKDWRTCDNLKLLNLLYDLTPMQYIIMVITEVGMIPPTSVPVILREYRKEPML